MTATLNNFRVIEIHDTRQVEIVDDRPKRIAGSGLPRACDHCGASHEIHVTVTDGVTTLVVGSSCARGLAKSPALRRSFVHETPMKIAVSTRFITWAMPNGDTFRTER
jgi:hypothetical protein